MEIVKVSIVKAEGEGIIKAFAIVDTDTFRLWDVKILNKGNKLVVALPSKKKMRNNKQEYHPYIRFNQAEWDKLKNAVIEEYQGG